MKYDVTMRAGDRVSCQTKTGIRIGTFAKPMKPNVHTWGYVLLDGDEDYTPLPFANMVPLKGKLTDTEKFLAEYAAICEKYSMQIWGVESTTRLYAGHGDEILYEDFDPNLDESVWGTECPDPY